MKANFCVDYLSHEWDSSDTIQAYREIQNQISKASYDTITKNYSFKDSKKIVNERNQLIRFENAIWRQMAKTCTKHLGTNNQMVHPSTVNWQKESDITWLYGPLYLPLSLAYTDDIYNYNTSSIASPSSRSECIRELFKLSNKRFLSNKCVSESGKQRRRLSVRFDPDITKLEYLPESPVDESIPFPHNIADEDNDDEDEEDEEFFKAIVYIGNYIKQLILTTLFGSQQQEKEENKVIISPERRELSKFCISIVSFAAWLVYQTIVLFSTAINRALGVPINHQIKASC